MIRNTIGENPTEITRENEIVLAAVPIFLRFGYKKTSMDAVAAAAKLSRQAVYLHFSNKEALFSAVVNSLCASTRDVVHIALWRPGLSLDEQLLAAFDESMPTESMQQLSELLATAKELVPQSVADIDVLVVQEISSRLNNALDQSQWPLADVTVQQASELLQATSYGLKQQTHLRSDYLIGMRAAIILVLSVGGLIPSTRQDRRQSADVHDKGAPQ